jgi:hypothetical protein
VNAAERDKVLSDTVPAYIYRALEMLQQEANDRSASLGLQVAVMNTVEYVAQLAREHNEAQRELEQLRRGAAVSSSDIEPAQAAL